ncbi:DUF3822 family protein [Xanthomarina spongicola]|uniref:Uncharacterized protein DUF3822 n=1 Tax=Xanthomarina spongicola TaxID=570520 RepID=A0A316DG96_9FLAO|nr:DUF3822 family protein [Xanthomarina spongicola]PWK17144.1 uncharacterized protein DUF3822 [Xanthomarina spongicola]
MGIGQKLMEIANKTKNISTHIDLSIQISLNGLSFCILNRDTNTITYLKHFKENKKLNPFDALDLLKHLFNTEIELQQDFANIHVIYINELATIVPKSLFNEDLLADYLKFNSKILKSDFIAFDSLEINDSVTVYVPYVNINNYIFETFGSFTYNHFSSILIEKILQIEKHAEDAKLYVHINKEHFELVVTDKGKLILYNTFDYSSKEDFIYYILFTLEQLKLNPEKIKLILLGDVDKDSELYTIAYKYIRHISFGARTDSYNYTNNPKSNYSDFVLTQSF